MANTDTEAQRESRTKVAGVKCTPSEYRRVKIVASIHEASVSQMLRENSLNDLLKEYERRVEEPTSPTAS